MTQKTLIKCCRCRKQMTLSDLVEKPSRSKSPAALTDMVCPSCGCKNFHDMAPQVAWCWRSGRIEVGDNLPDAGPEGDGPIRIADGPKAFLQGRLEVVARHAYERGVLLVPGVPEAEDEQAALKALSDWLKWCGKSRARDGITFAEEVA